MKVKFAHLREPAASGGWVNFAVFDARSPSGSDSDNASLLLALTARARAARRQIDQSALAFMSGGRLMYYGSKHLVDYLSKAGLPRWTHEIDY
jgi:hypothetical protein